MNRIERVFDGIEQVLGWIVAVLCIVLLTALFVQVINRYFLGISWPILQLIVPFCFLWMCLIGSAIAVRRHQHFEVDLLARVLGPMGRYVQAIAMSLLVLIGGAIIAWTSIGFTELGLLKKHPATGVHMVYIYSSLLVGGGLISLIALEKLIRQLGRLATAIKEADHDA